MYLLACFLPSAPSLLVCCTTQGSEELVCYSSSSDVCDWNVMDNWKEQNVISNYQVDMALSLSLFPTLSPPLSTDGTATVFKTSLYWVGFNLSPAEHTSDTGTVIADIDASLGIHHMISAHDKARPFQQRGRCLFSEQGIPASHIIWCGKALFSF